MVAVMPHAFETPCDINPCATYNTQPRLYLAFWRTLRRCSVPAPTTDLACFRDIEPATGGVATRVARRGTAIVIGLLGQRLQSCLGRTAQVRLCRDDGGATAGGRGGDLRICRRRWGCRGWGWGGLGKEVAVLGIASVDRGWRLERLAPTSS